MAFAMEELHPQCFCPSEIYLFEIQSHFRRQQKRRFSGLRTNRFPNEAVPLSLTCELDRPLLNQSTLSHLWIFLI